MGDVEPGSIIRYGIDDDMTCLVLSNCLTVVTTRDVRGGPKEVQRQTLLMLGCFCDEPDSYERGRLMTATFGDLDTVAVILEPDMF